MASLWTGGGLNLTGTYPIINMQLGINATNSGSGSYTITSNGTLTYGTVGSNACVGFNNSNGNYIMINYGAAVPRQFTVMFGLYMTGTTTATVFSVCDGTFASTKLVMNCDINDGSSTLFTPYIALPTQWTTAGTSSTYPGQNVWVHFAFSVDLTTFTLKRYVNGVLLRTDTGTAATLWDSTMKYFVLGRSGDNAPRGTNGYMRNFMVWDRILSDSDVMSNYNTF